MTRSRRRRTTVFVLGAVSSIAGIMAMEAGCTTAEIRVAADASSDVRSERRPIEAAAEDAATCLGDPKKTPDGYEQSPGYKPGKQQRGACTAADLTKFEANLGDTSIKTWKELGNDLSMPCAECIVTSKDAEHWGPVVYTDAEGELGFYNFGACFGVVEKESCGKAIQFLEWCLDDACQACATQADRAPCIDSAGDTGGVCAVFGDMLAAECTNLTKSGTQCNDIRDATDFLCGPAASDAGNDAGDAGDSGDAADAADQ